MDGYTAVVLSNILVLLLSGSPGPTQGVEMTRTPLHLPFSPPQVPCDVVLLA